jgi:hypothetical protein
MNGKRTNQVTLLRDERPAIKLKLKARGFLKTVKGMKITPTTLIAATALFSTTAFAQQTVWHTTPDKWQEPRIFHTPLQSTFTNRIQVGRNIVAITGSEHVVSPNRAYFFMLLKPDTTAPGPWNTVISINNERPGLLQVLIRDHAQYDPDIRWINEKLLYIRVWWGRVLGTDLILDVEKETITYEEMINDGQVPFQQWKEQRITDPGH